MAKASELAELDEEELETRLAEYRRELLNLRFQIATSQLDNVSRISAVRKDIARVMTLMREREIALAEGRELVPAIAHPRPVPHHLEEPAPAVQAEELAGQDIGEELDAEAEEHVAGVSSQALDEGDASAEGEDEAEDLEENLEDDGEDYEDDEEEEGD